jgi:virginiamycin B lyase
MIVDDKDRLWFAETGLKPNRLAGFNPANETFIGITDIPSGGGSVRHMMYDAGTRAIWFGADTNTVGRAIVP